MKEVPSVSVLITAYNREKYISEAIESVLASSFKDFELIIVDDCSSDNTYVIANTYLAKDKRIRLYRNEKNIGQFRNRNYAASLARAELIKYLDSDDLLYPHGLQKMVEAMVQFPEAAAGSELQTNVTSSKLPIVFSSREAYINHYFNSNSLLYIGPSGSIFRKKAFDEINGFHEEAGILADTLFMLQIAARYSVVGFEKKLFFWRTHNEQVTIGQRNWYEMQLQRYQINEIILKETENCLTHLERKVIKRNIKNILIRNIVKEFFRKRDKKELLKLIQEASIKKQDFMLSLLPNRKLKI